MVAQSVFFFLARATFQEREGRSTEMDVKNVNVILKLPVDNIFPWFASLSTIEIASKRSKLCIEITRLRLLVPLQF